MITLRRNGFFAIWALLLLSAAASPLRAQTPEPGSLPPLGTETATSSEASQAKAAPHSIYTPRLQFSGFGTLGLVYTHARDLRFIRPSTNHPGSENPDLGPDTVIGVQGNLSLGPYASVVVQAVSREDPLGNYAPRASLAFASFSPTQHLTVRLGRLRTPFFMFSETIDMNYASPWIRPPSEIYSLFPFNELDGIDFLVRANFGGFNFEVHPYFGTSTLRIYQGGEGRLKNARGINITVTDGRLTAFVSHGKTDFSLKWKGDDFTALSSVLLAYAPNGREVLQDLSGSDGSGSFSAAGMQWDNGHWLLIGEYNRLRSNRYTHDAHAWEVTAARRFGNFMPYLTFASHTEDRPISTRTTGNPMLDGYLKAFLASRNLSQRSVTLGGRWDFHRNTALKLEFNRARISGDGWGSFFPTDIAEARMEKRFVNTVGLSVDITF